VLRQRLGAQEAQRRAGGLREIRRAGLEGTGGLELQLGQEAKAAGQFAFAQNIGQFESQLLAAQAQERELQRRGGFDLMNRMLGLGREAFFNEQLIRLQASLAEDAEKRGLFGQIGGALGGLLGTGIAGFVAGGPVGAGLALAGQAIPESRLR
jgi:hypothetical protein